VQTFDTTSTPYAITNGIFIGDFSVIKFFGTFEWLVKPRKLEFDFDEIMLFGGLRFSLPKGGAAKIGASSGLGAENNVENINKGRKPFFNWISADDTIATARGGGTYGTLSPVLAKCCTSSHVHLVSTSIDGLDGFRKRLETAISRTCIVFLLALLSDYRWRTCALEASRDIKQHLLCHFLGIHT
jgi:hypothetical protein